MAKIDIGPLGKLFITLKSESNSGYSVEIPETEAGIKYLLFLLKSQRRTEKYNESPKIGTVASPTQQMVDTWIATRKGVNLPKNEKRVAWLEVEEGEL